MCPWTAVYLHQPEPSRLLSAASAMFRPSFAMAASRGDSPESRRDSGRGKLGLECPFPNSPKFTAVGFGGVFLGELARCSGGPQEGHERVAGAEVPEAAGARPGPPE